MLSIEKAGKAARATAQIPCARHVRVACPYRGPRLHERSCVGTEGHIRSSVPVTAQRVLDEVPNILNTLESWMRLARPVTTTIRKASGTTFGGMTGGVCMEDADRLHGVHIRLPEVPSQLSNAINAVSLTQASSRLQQWRNGRV